MVRISVLKNSKLNPNKAYVYISKYNICCTTIGMVSVEEARESTEIALQYLQNSNNNKQIDLK